MRQSGQIQLQLILEINILINRAKKILELHKSKGFYYNKTHNESIEKLMRSIELFGEAQVETSRLHNQSSEKNIHSICQSLILLSVIVSSTVLGVKIIDKF